MFVHVSLYKDQGVKALAALQNTTQDISSTVWTQSLVHNIMNIGPGSVSCTRTE